MTLAEALESKTPIAFIGRAGSGKTTCAKIVADAYGYRVLSLAKPIKLTIAALFPHIQGKPRKLYQSFGDWARFHDPEVFVRLLLMDADGEPGPWCVDDVRLPDEMDALRARGAFLVRVDAPEELRERRITKRDGWVDFSALGHHTETQADEAEVDCVLENNGTMKALRSYFL